jgi:hypothetical protein
MMSDMFSIPWRNDADDSLHTQESGRDGATGIIDGQQVLAFFATATACSWFLAHA